MRSVNPDDGVGRGRLRRRVLLGAAILAAVASGAVSASAQQNVQGVDFSVVAGQQFSGKVATFEGVGIAEDYSATIVWGDGTPQSAGTVSARTPCASSGENCFEVTGAHTYVAAGTFTVTTTINGLGGTKQATATATVTVPPGPPPPPPPPTPPPPPGAPTARIILASSEVRPGQPALVDASRSSGDIKLYAFDLNGDGTYESKSTSPVASVIYTVGGTKTVGVQVVARNGRTAVSAAVLKVAGRAVKPPAGRAPLAPGTVVGSVGTGPLDALVKNLTCPTMVQVGTAEATISQLKEFPPTPGEPCFQRVEAPNKPRGTFNPNDYPQFVAGKHRVSVNGLEIDTRPDPNAINNNLVIFEKRKLISQEHPGWQPVEIRLQKAGFGSLISKRFKLGTWNVASPGTVGTFPIEGFWHPMLMGLPVVAKDVPLKFLAGHRSELPVFVSPPFDLSSLGQQDSPTGQSPLTVRADNTDGMQVEGSIVASGGKYELDLPLGIFHLSGTLYYSQEGASNVWSGDVNLRIPDTPVDNINGYVRFRDGSFEQATVKAPFKRPGLGPIGCCVYLVGLEGQLTSHSIQGSATFAAGPDLIGDFRVAEATATVNIQYSPFALVLKANPLKIAKWDVGATTQVLITPNMFFGYAFWVGGLGPLDWRLNVQTTIGKPWSIAGGGTACAKVWPLKGCANVYGAAGPQGVTVCAGIDLYVTSIEAGIRVPWNPLSIGSYSTYTGCSFSLVKAKVSAATAAALRAGAAAGSYPVEVPRGLRAALFVIRGRGGRPQVRLRGPRGTEITTPPAGVDTSRGNGWLAVRQTSDGSVLVFVGKPAAGRWTVRELAGSPAVMSVGLAAALPRRFASGRITGRGRTRTLHYAVVRAPGTQVTFVERGGNPAQADPEQLVEQTIGRARGSKGTITFTPGEAKLRQRRIEAVVESQGAVIKTEMVASFTAPRFQLRPAPRVKVRWAGRALIARWSNVIGARAYQVFVNRSDGQTRYLRRRARNRNIRVAGFNGLSSAIVEVRAVSPAGYIGKPGRARLRAPRPSEVSRGQRIMAVLRVGRFTARCIAAGDGPCEVTVTNGGRTLASGAQRLRYGQAGRVSVKLTRGGREALLRARRSGRALVATLVATPPGVGAATMRVHFR